VAYAWIVLPLPFMLWVRTTKSRAAFAGIAPSGRAVDGAAEGELPGRPGAGRPPEALWDAGGAGGRMNYSCKPVRETAPGRFLRTRTKAEVVGYR
jgi:hypothetical protein